MTALRPAIPIALTTLLLGCASGPGLTRRHVIPPPARETRAGAPEKSAGPEPGSPTSLSPRPPPATGTDKASDANVTLAVEAASSLVGRRTIVLDGVDYGTDCTALVRAAFARAGRPLPPDVRDAASLHGFAKQRGALSSGRRPVPGDLVFLADRQGGPPSHVGLVARADPDGTALLLHRVARGVLRVRINLAYPTRPTDPATGKHINDTLVVNARAVPAGSLVVGVSDLLRRG